MSDLQKENSDDVYDVDAADFPRCDVGVRAAGGFGDRTTFDGAARVSAVSPVDRQRTANTTIDEACSTRRNDAGATIPTAVQSETDLHPPRRRTTTCPQLACRRAMQGPDDVDHDDDDDDHLGPPFRRRAYSEPVPAVFYDVASQLRTIGDELNTDYTNGGTQVCRRINIRLSAGGFNRLSVKAGVEKCG